MAEPDGIIDVTQYYGLSVEVSTVDDGPAELWPCSYCGAYVHTLARWSHTMRCRLLTTLLHNQLRALPENDEFHRGGTLIHAVSGMHICHEISQPHRALNGQPMPCPDCRRVML